MRKLAALAIAAALAGSAAPAALANPGDNGNNTKGLCTAYFNGSDNGRAHKRQAPPFRTLEEQALEEWRENNDEDPEYIEQAVQEYCENRLGEGGIGGNPDFGETPEPDKGGNPHENPGKARGRG